MVFHPFLLINRNRCYMRLYSILLLLNLNLNKNRFDKTQVVKFPLNISHGKKKEAFKLSINNLYDTILSLLVCVHVYV